MRVILISAQHQHSALVQQYIGDDLEFFAYDDPIKVLDNLVELAPDIIIYSAHDFPRHWKPLLMLTQQFFPASNFFLLADVPLHIIERRKASRMNVSGILSAEKMGTYSAAAAAGAEKKLRSLCVPSSATNTPIPALLQLPNSLPLLLAEILSHSENTLKLAYDERSTRALRSGDQVYVSYCSNDTLYSGWVAVLSKSGVSGDIFITRPACVTTGV